MPDAERDLPVALVTELTYLPVEATCPALVSWAVVGNVPYCAKYSEIAAFQPADAAVEIEVLVLRGLLLLFELLLQFLDLSAQALILALEFGDLVEQVLVARTHRRELLLQRGEAVGRAHPLRERRHGETEGEHGDDGQQRTMGFHDGDDLICDEGRTTDTARGADRRPGRETHFAV